MNTTVNRRQVLTGAAVAASIPAASLAAPAPRRSLAEMIGAYLSARATYDAAEAIHGDDVFDRHEWTDYLGAERGLISYRCADDAERRAKVSFVLGDNYLLDTVNNNFLDGVPVLRRFLSALI